MNLLEKISNGNLIPNQESITDKNWFDQDTEELYQKNLKEQPKDWYYRTKKVEYNLNSFGYRTKEFDEIDWKNSIVMFGCSYVFGVGNAEDDTISYQLEKMIGIPVINLGSPGSSPTFSLHNSILLKKYYPTPKAIVNFWSSPYRCPYYTSKNVIHCGSWNADQLSYSKAWNSDHNNPLVNLKLNSMIFKELWKDETEYYEITLFPSTSKLIKCDYVMQIDNGRDIRKEGSQYVGHAGRNTYRKAAERVKLNLQL